MRLSGLSSDGSFRTSLARVWRPIGFPLRDELVLVTARCWIVLAVAFYAFDVWRTTRVGLSNGAERPLGWDFINSWSGAFLAWHGKVGEVYNWFAFHAFQQGLIGAPLDFFHYSYPPTLLVLTAPLAALPYVPALAVWLLASWYAFYRMLGLALPKGAGLLALATPAVFVNAIGGQNGAWTAALMGGGLSLLDRRPAIAGVLFGLLSYKPQLGLLIPVALVAGRRWRAVVAATVTVVVLVGVSALLFGVDTWAEYLRNLTVLRESVLEEGSGVWHRFVSVFMATRRVTGSVEVAYVVQGLAAAAVGVVVAVAWFRDAPAALRNVLLVVGTVLATPYVQDYDLVVGAFVVAWLLTEARETPRLMNAVLWASALILLMPFVSSVLAKATGLVWAPLFALPAFWIAARQALGPTDASVAGSD